MRPAAFFFDLDGTLIDSEMLWAHAISEWLADHGQKATPDALAQLVFGHSWLDIHAAIHAAFPALPAAKPIDDAYALRPYYKRLATDPAKLVIQSAVDFLRKAARIAPCAIVSGSPHKDVEEAAALCGVTESLAFVLGAEDYSSGKPAPDGFLAAATKLDVDASECVVVEDSSAGVASGRAAGMHVLGVDRNTVVRQDFTGCDWLVHDLSEMDVLAVFGGEA
jgi:HAD superfamily hydrolase (TIGR01509 family)